MTKRELEEVVREFQLWSEADQINIHNKLCQPERQKNESVHDYRYRIRSAAILQGYRDDDYVVTW